MTTEKTKPRVHIAQVIADKNPVPYLNWFAQRAQQDDRIHFSFVFLNEDSSAIADTMSNWGAEVHHIPFAFNNTKKSLITSYFKLKRLLKKIQPDIVHTHLFYDGMAGTLAAKHAGVKILVHTKQSTGIHWQENKWAVKVDRWLNKNNSHLIAVSGECEKFIVSEEKGSSAKITLIHHGIEPEDLTKPTQYEIDEVKRIVNYQNERIILNLSRCVPWKNQKHIILAAKDLVEEYPDVKFVCAGQGPLLNELREQVVHFGLENKVLFTGNIDKKLIPALFHISNIYLHAAKMEPFGFVIPEAMFNEIPIVSTPTGSALDGIKHLESGYLAKYDNPESLADGMRYMLNLSQADKNNIAEKGKTTAHRLFHIDLMYEKTLQLYLDAYNKIG